MISSEIAFIKKDELPKSSRLTQSQNKKFNLIILPSQRKIFVRIG